MGLNRGLVDGQAGPIGLHDTAAGSQNVLVGTHFLNVLVHLDSCFTWFLHKVNHEVDLTRTRTKTTT